MNIIKALGAQGEVRIFKVGALPADVTPFEKENGVYIIGHSETGHHHVLVAERAEVYEAQNAPQGMRILYALLESPGELKHLRSHDTHGSHHFEPGIYMFRNDREYDPYQDLARRVAD